MSEVFLDVTVDYDDFERAREEALRCGEPIDRFVVPASVDLDEALEEATVDQLREALGREETGYTERQLDAIRECFGALVCGDVSLAMALATRIFDHPAQIVAAEAGVAAAIHRRAA